MIETISLNDSLVVRLTIKEASLVQSDQFKQELFLLLDKGHKRIVINLEEVTYIDSSFLGALVASLKHALFLKADIVLANLNKDILGLFELIRMDKVFSIYQSVEEAVEN